uniref:Putative secreted protein n=1 Tax=Ixodes ricinus TaxID=34613 RepID=A0A147BRZ8_IXORI
MRLSLWLLVRFSSFICCVSRVGFCKKWILFLHELSNKMRPSQKNLPLCFDAKLRGGLRLNLRTTMFSVPLCSLMYWVSESRNNRVFFSPQIGGFQAWVCRVPLVDLPN